MADSDNTTASQLAAKIQLLLSSASPEQRLVGLLLLTRWPDDDHSFASWFHHHPVWDICAKLLSQQPQATVSRLYGRLVGQLVYRAAPCKSLDHEVTLRRLGRGLAVHQHWTALRVLLASINDLRVLDAFLVDTWSIQTTKVSSSKTTISSPTQEKQDADCSPEQELMNQTVSALLDQTAIDETCSYKELLMENCLRLLMADRTDTGNQHSPKLPAVVEQMLQEWNCGSTDPQQTSLSAYVVLTVLKYAQSSHDMSLIDSHKDALFKLLLACMVSVDDKELRRLSWESVLNLLRLSGWSWMLSNSSNGKLGSYTQVCVLLRLAVGEFKIQLGRLLEEEQPSRGSNDTTTPTVALVEASGQYIAQSIDFIVEQDNIGIDGISHIHKSLEESLHCCIDYLDTRSDSTMVLHVFSKLLSEMDVFETKNHTALQALRRAMVSSHYNSLLTALTAVLASAEGISDRVDLLNEYGLTSAPLVDFLDRFWDTRNDNDRKSVEWACQLIELWSSISTVVDRTKAQGWLIQYLKRQIKADARSSFDTKEAIEAVVACYTTLQGDQSPGEPDATILQEALKRSTRF